MDYMAEPGTHRAEYDPRRDTPLPFAMENLPRHLRRETKAGWDAWFRIYKKGL